MSVAKTWFGRYWWIVFMPLALIALVWGVLAWLRRNTEFDFKFDNRLLSLLPQIQGRYAGREATDRGIGLYLSVPLTTLIKNDNPVPLRMNNTSFELAYQGEPIMRTSPDSMGVKAKVPAGGEQPVTDNVDILINGKTIDFIQSLIKREKPKVDYNIQTRLYGVPYSFKGAKVLNEEKAETQPQ